MKNKISALLISVVWIGCGDGNEENKKSVEDIIASKDIKLIKAEKTRLDKELENLTLSVDKLSKILGDLDPNKKYPVVTIKSVEKEPYQHFVDFQGNVRSKKNVLVFPEMSGQLEKLYVEKGSAVKKGQTIAKIESASLQAQVKQMEAQLALTKTLFERRQRLWEKKVGSEIEYLQAKSNFEAQSNALKNLKVNLGKTYVKAPFTGVIDEVITEAGNIVSPASNQAIVRVVNLSNMYVKTELPEKYFTTIKKGNEVEVEFPVLGKKIKSKVYQTGTYIDPRNRTFSIEVKLTNKDRDIIPNLTTKLKINDYTNNEAILVAQNVISEDAKGRSYLYVAKTTNRKGIYEVSKQFVETGKAQAGVIEILSGIEVGQQIVIEGARSVEQGQKVRIAK